MIHPLAALLLINTLAQAAAYSQIDCNKGYGPVNLTEAVEAVNLIPVPEINTQLSPVHNGGRMTLVIPEAAHRVRPPVVFHLNHTIIEIEETRLFRGEQALGYLSRSEEAFFLWVEARAKVFDVIKHCVVPNNGEYGGWARILVEPQGQPKRRFKVRLRGTKHTAFILRNRRDKGYDIWPGLLDPLAPPLQNLSGVFDY